MFVVELFWFLYFDARKKVKPSFYIKKQISDTDPETLILYSTKTSALILIPKGLYEAMEEGSLSPDEEDTLKELGFMVEDQEQERDEIIGLYDSIDPPHLQIILVLNLDCNFSCRYCFEGNKKPGLYMSAHVLDRAMEFIKAELEKGRVSELLLALYGGEPLLSPGLTRDALTRAKEICTDMGIGFRASIVTNGSLLDKRMAKELSALGLQKARVTLDGPPEIHNHFRPFKNGAKSFDIILNNIKESIGFIKRLEIGGNYSRQNYKEFPRLLDILLQEGITPDKVEIIRFEPIIRQPSGISIYKGGCSSINEPWVAEAGLFLREEILKRGYRTRRIEPIFCLVNNKKSFIINMDGGLYKCPGFLGIKQFQIGDVFEGPNEPEAYNPNRWKNEKCASCIYLPLCFGGCRYISYIRYGDLSKLDCQKSFFDNNLEAFIKQDIRYKRDIG